MSCCTSLVIFLPAMGMEWMAEPMTYPSLTGITCVQPAPLSMTVPVIFPRALCMHRQRSHISHMTLLALCHLLFRLPHNQAHMSLHPLTAGLIRNQGGLTTLSEQSYTSCNHFIVQAHHGFGAQKGLQLAQYSLKVRSCSLLHP